MKTPALFSKILAELQPASLNDLQLLRRILDQGRAQLNTYFFENKSRVAELISQWTHFIDRLLQHLWQLHGLNDATTLTLIAVGGYGRGELFPASDIDLLILTEDALNAATREAITAFVRCCWDMHLEIGHSVRNLADCLAVATADLNTATALFEARRLIGDDQLFARLQTALSSNELWPSAQFFAAKRAEQRQRHKKYSQTAYNLEPDVKNSPGGLRDLQTLLWVVNRHCAITDLNGLLQQHFITAQEYATLSDCQLLLWQIRFALHCLNGKHDDRLSFDMQRQLAAHLGYHDESENHGIEQLMKNYYRAVKNIRALNELVLQLLDETLFCTTTTPKIQSLNPHFQIINNRISAIKSSLFADNPATVFELFVLLAQHPKIQGISATTIRLLREASELIDEKFYSDPAHRHLFMQLLQQPAGVAAQLQRMNDYGILGRYLPIFGNIVGQMQYDLFHIYTVDQHILFVIANLERFRLTEYAAEFPFCTQLMQTLDKPELIYIAALFHDIAKGRHGDHSTLGATDAEKFCADHGCSKADIELVSWLVQEHLLMSFTAQRRDINDVTVISEFCKKVKDVRRLNYLYLLTVADIRATNNNLWNGYKDTLLKQLYHYTEQSLLQQPRAQIEIIRLKKQQALQELLKQGIAENAIQDLWHQLGGNYFLNYSAEEITWHTREILQQQEKQQPLVLLRTQHNSTALFIHAVDRANLFATIVSVLSQSGLNIVEARIITSKNNYSLDTFHVLAPDGLPLREEHDFTRLQQRLSRQLLHCEPMPVKQQIPRQLRHFPLKTRVTLHNEPEKLRTTLEVSSLDYPGLLAKIGQVFIECGIQVHNAKIATFGERAEDTFYITDQHNQPITEPSQQKNLQKMIVKALDI